MSENASFEHCHPMDPAIPDCPAIANGQGDKVTTPVDLMQNFRAIVNAAAPDLTAISIGAVSGRRNLTPHTHPFGALAARKRKPKCRKPTGALMLTCSPKTQKKPTASATLSMTPLDSIAMVRVQSQLPSHLQLGGPLDFVDEDRRLPAVFRRLLRDLRGVSLDGRSNRTNT